MLQKLKHNYAEFNEPEIRGSNTDNYNGHGEAGCMHKSFPGLLHVGYHAVSENQQHEVVLQNKKMSTIEHRGSRCSDDQI